MNKSKIFIGIGILAIGGLAYWYFTKPSQAGATDNTDQSTSEVPSEMTSPIGKTGAVKSKKQTRRDCRAEAKASGLKGREKRQFKRDCKAAGGVNADTADFAFNGFDGAFEFA